MDVVELDLHGIKHEDVRNKVIRLIEENWQTGNELEIITGRSVRMKGIVLNVLDEYKLSYNIGRMTNLNDGCIITWT